MKEIRIRFDYQNGPLWGSVYDGKNSRFLTGIGLVDEDPLLQALNKEGQKLFCSFYHFAEEDGWTFDEAGFQKEKTKLKQIVDELKKRLENINDGSFAVIDEASGLLSMDYSGMNERLYKTGKPGIILDLSTAKPVYGKDNGKS